MTSKPLSNHATLAHSDLRRLSLTPRLQPGAQRPTTLALGSLVFRRWPLSKSQISNVKSALHLGLPLNQRLNQVLISCLLLTACNQNAKPPTAEQPPAATQPAVTNSNGLAMVLIPAGEFLMGDNDGEADEKPAHKVRLSAFYMDTREVTQGAYEALMEKNPSKAKGADKPVEQVDWYHAILFCNMRSLKEGRKPCYDPKTLACDFSANGYRLPTEAEWEYACRAGARGKYSFGDDPAKLKAAAWFKENAGQTTHAVGQKTPNPWGLYDMHGNVAEWCHDFYSESYYAKGEGTDPHGPAASDRCVLRGGSWRTGPDACRSTARNSETPRFADACFGSDACGFRCVRR